MKPQAPRWAPALMTLAALTLFASPAAGLPLIDAETTNADVFGASTEDAPKALLLTFSAPQHDMQMVAPGTIVVYVEDLMDGSITSLFIWKAVETNGVLMKHKLVVTLENPMDVAEGESVMGFIMTDDGKMNGIIITKVNGLILWENGMIIDPLNGGTP